MSQLQHRISRGSQIAKQHDRSHATVTMEPPPLTQNGLAHMARLTVVKRKPSKIFEQPVVRIRTLVHKFEVFSAAVTIIAIPRAYRIAQHLRPAQCGTLMNHTIVVIECFRCRSCSFLLIASLIAKTMQTKHLCKFT